MAKKIQGAPVVAIEPVVFEELRILQQLELVKARFEAIGVEAPSMDKPVKDALTHLQKVIDWCNFIEKALK